MFWKKKNETKYIVIDCAFNCIKEKCPKWVVLNHFVTDDKGNTKNVPEGKCAVAWIPYLMIELLGKNANKK